MELDILSQEARESAETLREQFASARPFRHVVIDGLLDQEFIGRLAEEFPRFSKEHALNEFGQVGGKAVRNDLRNLGPAYQRFDALMADRDFLGWLSRVTGIPHLRYDPDYLGGGTHENVDGQELDPHVDFNFHTNGVWHRRLNLILFLNDRWQAEWGGCLQLHKNPWAPPSEDETRTVAPDSNRAVIFETTENSWHGFPRISLPPHARGSSRKTIAVYFYTEERPAAETVPEHGTYYVPRPFPESVVAEQPLTAGQVAELKDLFERRNQQIRFLWESERELKERLIRVDRSVSVRLARAVTWPLWKLKATLRRS